MIVVHFDSKSGEKGFENLLTRMLCARQRLGNRRGVLLKQKLSGPDVGLGLTAICRRLVVVSDGRRRVVQRVPSFPEYRLHE